jgi:hypothetical protein
MLAEKSDVFDAIEQAKEVSTTPTGFFNPFE